MRKVLLFTLLCALFSTLGFSQTDKLWSSNAGTEKIVTDKAVARQSFPTDFKLFNLDIQPLRQNLFSVVDGAAKHSTVISLPNADGQIEQFEVVEASNFEPALQAQFPQIRAFSGKGITDPYATLKLSIAPGGIQTMVFRTDRPNEYIEPYSGDHTVYAVFKSQRVKGGLPWLCSTPDADLALNLNAKIQGGNGADFTGSSAGELKTMRLAQSCNGEYSNFFGATSSAQVGLVLAAFNATLTRCNGCYEKDLALHLNLIANTAAVIYYDPATDPYTTLGAWNGQLQATLISVIGSANYDIGHMFGASGGGGNAGCIGCVCNDANKGSGITSPADGIPQGDNFDIDYVAHEVGHQLGGNHTFSMSSEGTGVNKEVGSGITIMGYAGITAQDVAPHSIDIFHQATIQQIQTNLATKTCPITTNINATNATPVVGAVSASIIPISTPFELTGSATDANAGDALTYCWEQNDNSTTTGVNSVASPTKLTGPNWLSFPATASGTRTFPRLSTVLAGLFVTGPLPGGDANANIEALSSVGRVLNFRLTVRDNAPYSPTAPVKVGQTAFTDVAITVTPTSGPFQVTQPNTNVSWAGGSTQTITWDVNNTTAPPVSCANVRIMYSTDGGQTFPTTLSASTANDGTETVTIPAGSTTTARIKIMAIGNIFFDISNTNFTVTVPLVSFGLTAPAATNVPCAATSATATLATTTTGGFNTPITLSATSGVPAGTTVTFSPNPVTPGNSATVNFNTIGALAPGTYNITVTGTAGAITQTAVVTFVLQSGAAITSQPAAQTVCNGTAAIFNVTASGTAVTYQWQSGPSATGPFTNVTGGTGANTASYSTGPTTPAMNGTYYRVVVGSACPGTVNSNAVLLTVNTVATITTQPTAQSACVPSPATFTVAATGTGLGYQWQVATPAAPTVFTNIPGATSATYTTGPTTLAMNGSVYRVLVSSTCSPGNPITSNAVVLTVNNPVTVTQNPLSQRGCAGDNYTFSVTATSGGGTITYQWQVSTDGGVTYTNIGTAGTGPSYVINNAPVSLNGNLYRVVVSGQPCGLVTTPAALLTLGNKPQVVLTVAAFSSLNPSILSGLYATVSPPGNYIYTWRKNGVIIPNTLGANSIPLTVDDFGSYSVSVIDVATGCSVSSNAVTVDSVASNRLFIYPNPVTSMMQVRYFSSNAASRGTTINVYDARGARVYSAAYTISGAYGRMDVNMSNMQTGIYLVEVRDASGKQLVSEKVMKVN